MPPHEPRLWRSGRGSPITCAMPLPPKPRLIWADIRSFFERRERHSLVALVPAIAIPCFIVWLFVLDGRTNIMPTDPVVIYAESWSLDRTDEEIIDRQAELALAADERRALTRERMQRLADQLGVDYDRRAAAEADRITEENRRLVEVRLESDGGGEAEGVEIGERRR